MNTEIIDAGRDISGGYKVDVSRGTNEDRVSSEWFSRPDDERYLSLDDLFASVKGRAEQSRTRTVESAAIRVEAHPGQNAAQGGPALQPGLPERRTTREHSPRHRPRVRKRRGRAAQGCAGLRLPRPKRRLCGRLGVGAGSVASPSVKTLDV